MNTIIYFDLNNKTPKRQLLFYEKEFVDCNFDFRELSIKEDFTDLVVLKNKIKNEIIYSSLIKLINYRSDMLCGFLVFYDKKVIVIDYNKLITDNVKDIDKIKSLTIPKLPIQIEYFLSKTKINTLPVINFSKEINENSIQKNKHIEWLKEVEKKLMKINDDSELLITLIELTKINERIAKKINYSQVIITSEYKLILPMFNDIEIKMSDLTKAIYILFYNHPNGIDLNKLNEYRIELLSIYLKLSKQSNYDKMLKSINKVINIDSKEIYVHLSRIKNAFEKKIAANYISEFIVKSDKHGSPVKKIKAILKK